LQPVRIPAETPKLALFDRKGGFLFPDRWLSYFGTAAFFARIMQVPLRLFMNQPFNNLHENQQFEELLRILVKMFYFNDKELCDCFANFIFEMDGKTKQYDVIIFRKYLIAIVEMKNMLGKIQGQPAEILGPLPTSNLKGGRSPMKKHFFSR
jgi:hypothetical protein